MSEVSPNVARSLAEAAAAASRLVEKCVDHAVHELQQAESHATGEKRQQIAEAWRELLVRRKGWSARFPQLLGPAFEAEAAGRPETGLPQPDSDDPTLSLVEDTEINRTIESARLAQQLTAMLERPLAELDALMSSALGLDVIQPERNPLRPAVYAQVLRDLMAEGQPNPAWPGLWMRHMTRPMAQELEQIYREQAHFLTLQRVHAANYRLRSAGGPASRPAPLNSGFGGLGPAASPSPSGGGPGWGRSGPAPLGGDSGHAPLAPNSGHAPLAANVGHAPTGANSAHTPLAAQAPHAAATDPAPHRADGARLQQFLQRADPQAQQPLAPSYYFEAEAEYRALQSRAEDAPPYDERAAREHMHLPPVDRPARRIDTDSPLPQQVWGKYSAPRQRALVRGKLKTEAREVGQVYGLEVVRRLVNRVADDPRLLAPVREAIVGLEPSLLRLAMVAPRFFSDAEHPGRLLVEGVAQRSFKYNDEFSVEFQGFFGAVAQSFQRLNDTDPLASAEPFRAALTALQAGWAAQDALDEENQRKVLDAVQFVERRQHEADRIASEFRQRPDLDGVADGVRDFVLGPWSLVVAHARLTQPSTIDPGGHIAVVSDLLWSVKRDLTLHEPARAFELIPRVLMKLRAGLALLGQQPQESEAFFHQLELLHRPVLKLRARQRHGAVAPPPALPAAEEPPTARAPDEPWMAPRELHAAGFEDAPASDSHLSGATRPPPVPAQPLEEHEAEQVVAQLAPGTLVDLYSHQHWRRARLKWASDKRTLFMFVSHGGEPHSMTRRSLQRLIRDRLLRPVDAEAVVPRALAQLAQQPAPAA